VAEENPMERPLLDYNNINAACQSYEAAKAFFGKIDPDAVIQFDSTIGAITVILSETGLWPFAAQTDEGDGVILPLLNDL
jgi:hypothetical protein